MITRFDRRLASIVVRGRIAGDGEERSVAFLLDAGATYTVVRPSLIDKVGAEPLGDEFSQTIVTASRLESARRYRCSWLAALGQRRDDFLILAHDLPLSAPVDGLLGLDFFRDHRLAIDFRAGTIDLD